VYAAAEPEMENGKPFGRGLSVGELSGGTDMDIETDF
jgi:hypothetical protein